MEQMQRDADSQRTDGFYNNVNMLHQYGAGNQDILLMSIREQTCLDGEGPLPCDGAGQAVRCLCDQRRDHAEPVARFLSGLHVRVDGQYRESPRRGDEEPGGA